MSGTIFEFDKDFSETFNKMPLSQFSYDPLSQGMIRLVKLETSPGLTFSVSVHNLEGSPAYTALSYTWGGEGRSHKILLNGGTFHITPNLSLFLQEARRRIEQIKMPPSSANDRLHWDGGYLWIDAICIDQSNVAEKTEQVTRMKDIYEYAQTIITWLGQASKGDELAMEYIEDWSRTPQNNILRSRFSSEDMPEAEWKTLRERALQSVKSLISRSYWRRVWIIQEATTPKDRSHSLVWCGPYTESSELFINSAHMLTSLSMVNGLPGILHNISTDALQALISIRELRKLYEYQVSIDHYQLLPYIHAFNSSDPRDKLFGIHSLLPSDITQPIRPDYSMDAEDIYRGLACSLIEKERTLDILGFCATRGDFDLPSWVPDWTATAMPKAFLRWTQNISGDRSRLYSASGGTDFDGIIDGRNGYLETSGFEFDALSWVSVPRFANSDQDYDVAMHWQQSALSPWSTYITGCTRQDALAHIVCADASVIDYIPQRGNTVPLPDHRDSLGILASPDPAVYDNTIQRLLFFTNKGYMGLAPYTAKVGDSICLLKGAQFPIILRKKVDTWCLIGESYVHGIMDGEGWHEMMASDDSKVDKSTEQVFMID